MSMQARLKTTARAAIQITNQMLRGAILHTWVQPITGTLHARNFAKGGRRGSLVRPTVDPFEQPIRHYVLNRD